MEADTFRDSVVSFQTNQGLELTATPLRLGRHQVAFELYTPNLILQMSEVLSGFKIRIDDQLVYAGRAVVSGVINSGSALIGEATLEEAWLDSEFLSSQNQTEGLQAGFERFIRVSQKAFHVLPAFKIVVADMQIFLMDLRRWLEQIELDVRSQPSGDRQQIEREAIHALQGPINLLLGGLFGRFEEACRGIEPELRPAHRTYVKRQLHPLVLCAPFMYRTFQKPLGYAGDYEMVNMMVRDPCEGGSVFAKILNTFFLTTPPVVAHRNRITRLHECLREESCRARRGNRPVKVFNLGCGSAQEVQDFLVQDDLSQTAQFTLVDFNEETLAHTNMVMNEIKQKHHRNTPMQLCKRSVSQILKEAAKPISAYSAADYDFVYCAGLFDYLPDHVCVRLLNMFYGMLAPGGLLMATNLDESNPSRNWMEYSVDWNLIHRDGKQMASLKPRAASPESSSVVAEPSGVNIFLQVRKLGNA